MRSQLIGHSSKLYPDLIKLNLGQEPLECIQNFWVAHPFVSHKFRFDIGLNPLCLTGGVVTDSAFQGM